VSAATWDPARYEGSHSYVWQLGAGLIDILSPQPGERILDIGCGTGQLTSQIADRGAHAVGLDKSPEMLGQARQNYPKIEFVLADIGDIRFDRPFDAVFSNAALHWVKAADSAAASMAAAMRPGARLVAEFGGKGCIGSVVAALRTVLGSSAEERNPWFFPSIGEYVPMLERHGLEVLQAHLFDRPTPVEGENGMEDWLRMFCGAFFSGLTAEQAGESNREITGLLRPRLYRDGVWTLDYRRLHLMAVKT
jgi:trans-aconitate methyltransferase